jgi:hypothetical protein
MRAIMRHAVSFAESCEIERETDISVLQSDTSLDGELIERAAQALFEFVFARAGRPNPRTTRVPSATHFKVLLRADMMNLL